MNSNLAPKHNALPDLVKKHSIYTYTDYRKFLVDRVELLKTLGLYRVRAFARSVGFASPNYLQMILRGKRNLGTRFVLPLSRALSLSPVETQFLRALVYFTDSKDLQLKDEAFQSMARFKGFREAYPLTIDQYQIFQDWRNVALLEGLSASWSRTKLATMASDLELTVEEIRERIALLAKLRLIEKDPLSGVWRRTSEGLTTESVVNDLNVRNFHREMIKRGLNSVDTFQLQERTVGGLTMSLSESDFQRLSKMVDEFTLKIVAEFSTTTLATDVYQLNFQIFPLLKQKT